MTVETSERLVVYVGNGVATNFPFNFVIPEADFASVNIQDEATGTVLETLPPGTYTLNGVGDPDGGSVDWPIDGSSPLDSSRQIVIIRTVPYTQETSISNQGGFLPRVLEQQLDLLEMQIQQVADEVSRSLVVNPGQEVPDLTAIAAAEYWALQAAASAAEAADYADFAKHNWVSVDILGTGVQTDWPLSIDPGTANNIIVELEGIFQRPGSAYTLVYVATVPTLRFTEPVPNGVLGLARMGSAIIQDVNVPTDGSVTTAKILNDAVTFAKLQNISTGVLLGRASGSSGDAEEINTGLLRDSFLPLGSIIDSAFTEYTANANLTTLLPTDDTVPLVTEGTQILSLSFTPKSATNKLRIRFFGEVSAASSAAVGWAIFDGSTCIRAGLVTVPAADNGTQIAGAVELVAGSTSAKTITVRIGGNSVTIRMNGTSGARAFGGASAATLTIEEIKA